MYFVKTWLRKISILTFGQKTTNCKHKNLQNNLNFSLFN